jgi:hypothetical protein
MDADEADRAQDQGQHRWFTVPFQFEPIGRVLAIMQRFYRFVTSARLSLPNQSESDVDR